LKPEAHPHVIFPKGSAAIVLWANLELVKDVTIGQAPEYNMAKVKFILSADLTFTTIWQPFQYMCMDDL
jgi:hypothetical protein